MYKRQGQITGVGLRNTRERLQTLYGDQHLFQVEEAKPSGVHISIRIPYESVMSDVPDNTNKKTYNFTG